MIKFAGKKIPDFVKVNKIGFTILPSVETKTLKVQGRAGVLDYGTELGERKIFAEITIITPKANEVLKYSTILAEWLFHTELQELILDDEPDKKYMARIEGDTAIDEMLQTGTGTLTFTCPSPFKESLTPKQAFFEGHQDIEPAVNSVENKGTTETFPQIEITVHEDMPALVVKNGTDKFFQIGEDVSDIIKAMPDDEIIIDDDASTLNGWTTPIKTDGVISGEIATDGQQFFVKDGKFGSAPLYWGGAGKLKSLPRPVQDFTWKINIDMMVEQIAERGKIEFQMFDKDDKELVKFGLYETSTITNHPYIMCELGGGLRKVVNFTPQVHGLWNHFVGYISLSRNGDYWGLYITVVDPVNGFEHSGQYFEWWDRDMIFGAPISKIQFYMGTFDPDAGKPSPTHMYVRPMTFKDLHPLPPEAVPITLKKNDKVFIDCKTATIRKNGKVAYEILHPLSDFFALKKGVNVLSLAPSNADMKINYTERWL